jgi:hypothetical protein
MPPTITGVDEVESGWQLQLRQHGRADKEWLNRQSGVGTRVA